MGAGKRILLTGLFLALVEHGLSQIKVEMGTGTVYNVSQKKAEKALAKLSKTAEKEDSWIYYKGQLIDNGKNEYSGTVMMHFPIVIRTGNIITDTVHIPPGDTVWMYHNHTYDSPPSIRDIVNQSLLMDSVFTSECAIPRVANDGKIWEFSLEQSLRDEFRGKNREERYEILESKINIAYTPENKYKFGGNYPYPYKPNPKDKKYKEYIKIMKEVGVNAGFRGPGRFK
ncbi:MAG: hypothetical protein ACP5OA_05630 [Candidatus Woesearchaeota archaeon]